MDTADSSAADFSVNNVEDRDAKIEKAVDNYVTNLAKELGNRKDGLKGIVSSLLSILRGDEFWNEKQKIEIEVKRICYENGC